jgi:hypothetical protein
MADFAGAGPNVCYTALSSAKQKSATAHCYRAIQRNPCKGGVTNIRACTCVGLGPLRNRASSKTGAVEAAGNYHRILGGG